MWLYMGVGDALGDALSVGRASVDLCSPVCVVRCRPLTPLPSTEDIHSSGNAEAETLVGQLRARGLVGSRALQALRVCVITKTADSDSREEYKCKCN